MKNIWADLKIFQVLLLNGADVNSVDSGQRSALLSACWQGHLVIADILLTAGANVNHQCGQVRGVQSYVLRESGYSGFLFS